MIIKRDYYPIAEAARILKCTEGDLIHLGAINKAQICVNIYGMEFSIENRSEMYDLNGDPEKYKLFENTRYGIYMLGSEDLRVIELPGGIPYELRFACQYKHGLWCIDFTSPVSIQFEHLCMLHAEVDRLSGDAISPAASETKKPPDANSVTVTLPHMNRALEAVFKIMRENWADTDLKRLPKQVNIGHEIDAALGWNTQQDGTPSRGAKVIAALIKPDFASDTE